MTSQSSKQMAITAIDEAMQAGSRQHKACALLGMSSRTLRRWRSDFHAQIRFRCRSDVSRDRERPD